MITNFCENVLTHTNDYRQHVWLNFFYGSKIFSSFIDIYNVIIKCFNDGKAKYFGVSNYYRLHIEEILDAGTGMFDGKLFFLFTFKHFRTKCFDIKPISFMDFDIKQMNCVYFDIKPINFLDFDIKPMICVYFDIKPIIVSVFWHKTNGFYLFWHKTNYFYVFWTLF